MMSKYFDTFFNYRLVISVFKYFCQLLGGPCTMAYLVLDTSAQLSKRLVVTFRLEDGVVSEALSSPTFTDNLTIDDTFKRLDLAIYY